MGVAQDRLNLRNAPSQPRTTIKKQVKTTRLRPQTPRNTTAPRRQPLRISKKAQRQLDSNRETPKLPLKVGISNIYSNCNPTNFINSHQVSVNLALLCKLTTVNIIILYRQQRQARWRRHRERLSRKPKKTEWPGRRNQATLKPGQQRDGCQGSVKSKQ